MDFNALSKRNVEIWPFSTNFDQCKQAILRSIWFYEFLNHVRTLHKRIFNLGKWLGTYLGIKLISGSKDHVVFPRYCQGEK